MEQESSGVLKWMTTTDDYSFVFEMGLGIGYFLSKNFSVSFDCKILMGNVRTYWTAENLDTGESESMDEIFYASTLQPMLIVRYWFR